MALEAELAKQKTRYQNSIEEAYSLSNLSSRSIPSVCTTPACAALYVFVRLNWPQHTVGEFVLFHIEEMRVKVLKEWAGMHHCLSPTITQHCLCTSPGCSHTHTHCMCTIMHVSQPPRIHIYAAWHSWRTHTHTHTPPRPPLTGLLCRGMSMRTHVLYFSRPL